MSVAPSGRRAAFEAAAACAASAVGMPACAADLNAVNHAGAIASSVVVGSAAPSLGVGAVLQTLVGLAVVIGLVFGCAWLARRFGFQPARRGGPLKLVSSVAVGAKESATIVEIGDTWLVLGVAPSGRAAPGTGGLSVNGASFGARFRDALAGEAAKRLGRGKER
ncbi:TPA: flagellar biosynthetic protein FliO [Burkholderia multivorans]|nr:flagellar biosynthetic protein FliO [Burkholderia multivorans]